MSKIAPREDIHEYLSTWVAGTQPPDILHLSKPVYDENGVSVAKGGESVIDLNLMMKELGLHDQKVPMDTFLVICEMLIRKFGDTDQNE